MPIYSSLFQLFYEYVETDDENFDKKSQRLKNTYNNANSDEKRLIDDLFITLCGYSLRHLIDKTEESEEF